MRVSLAKSLKPIELHRLLYNAVATFMAVAVFVCGAASAESIKLSDFRVSLADDKFPGSGQTAITFAVSAPEPLRAQRMELAIGSVTATTKSRAFVSYGPVWRLLGKSSRLFLEIGFSPTLIGGSAISGRDLGGNFHFTSSLAIGRSIGARHLTSISLRIQHTSNGGLNGTNPGIDMVGLNVQFGALE
jgi:hypothetical protein